MATEAAPAPASSNGPAQCEPGAIIRFDGYVFEILYVESRGANQPTKLVLQDISDERVTEADYKDVKARGEVVRAPLLEVEQSVPVSLECLIAESRAARGA